LEHFEQVPATNPFQPSEAIHQDKLSLLIHQVEQSSTIYQA